MYSPRVKICGIKTLEIAECAVENSADSLGFVFFERSPRAVDLTTARGIISNLPPFVNKTGVFVDKNFNEIMETVEKTGIDTIQLQGETQMYDRAFIENLSAGIPLPVILTLRMEIIDENSIGSLMNDSYPGVNAWQIDSKDPLEYGGTGKSALWRDISDKRIAEFLRSRVIIAGGINIGNIGSLFEKMLPYGIDVSSGLEKERGRKDKTLIKRFMEHLREISALYPETEETALY